MSARINYDDNLFFVNAWLKHLRQAISLDIDSEIFLHKIIEDILFIHDVLMKLMGNLQKNTFFIHRIEYLRLLLLAKKEFVGFIDELHVNQTAFAAALIPFRDQFMQCRDIHQADILAVNDILEGEAGHEQEDSDIISSDEYRFLFKQDADSDIV